MMARPNGKPRAMKDIKEAVEMYINDVKMDEIAAKFGVTQPTVSYWVRRHGKKIGEDRYIKSIRKQGRRPDTEPNARDKSIISMASVGVPAAHLALTHKVSRARASYIIKTWASRGYVPPPRFKPGQIIKTEPESPARYLIKKVNGHTGTVVKLVGLYHDRETFGVLNPKIEIEKLHWYAKGKLCEVVHDKAKS